VKIRVENIPEGTEPELIIRCNEMDDSLLQLITAIQSTAKRLIADDKAKIHIINPNNVFYFEAVDNKVFIYCRETVHEIKKKLYQIEEEYENSDFFRASKSVILNLSKIEALSPALNGRFEALLQNGEKVIISRQYVSELKKKLGM
jgi:DNA-binding LytR/AlgR family response regulator